MIKKHLAFGVSVLLLVLALAPTMRAQAAGGAGQIVGTVYDPSGALVPGTPVKLKSKDTGLALAQTTNAQGQYQFLLVPVGHYSLTFSRAGFKTYQASIEVTVGAVLTVNATLAVGPTSQVVEVTATPVIASTQPWPDALIGVQAIEDLPINGRRFHDFVTLTPAAQVEPQRQGISFVGQRGINANVMIDGADYNEPFFGSIRGGERAPFAETIPQEAISQFQVVAYGYSAEFGRSTGGLLNATTKSGTNEIHGSAFFVARHKSLASDDAFGRQAVSSLYQEGGSVGGPIKGNKIFFFAAFEDQQNNNPREVLFSRLVGFTPTAVEQEAFNFYEGLRAPFTQTNDALTGFGRLDFQPSPKQRIDVSYHYSKDTGENAVSVGTQISPLTTSALTNNGTEGDRTNTVVGHWTSTFSPTLINELVGQYSLENRPRLANSLEAGTSTSIGNTGTTSFLPTTLDDYRIQFADSLTWTHGRHAVKFGGEFDYLHVNQFFKFNQFGRFVFLFSNPTGAVLQDMSANPGINNRFDDPRILYEINIGNGELITHGETTAFFVQDTWRVTPRLTILPGFRWEGYFNPSPATSNSFLYNLVKDFPFPIGSTFDPAILPNNLHQFMPRLGIAWDPWGDAKTVIRADAGLFYATTPLLLYAAPLNNFRLPAGDLSVFLPFAQPNSTKPCASPDNTVYCEFNLIGIDLNSTPLTALPTLTPTQLGSIASAMGITPNPFLGTAPIGTANDYESPRSWQWSVGIERQVAHGWSVGADYVYINTVHLELDRNLNLPVPLICAGSPLPTGCTSADLSLRPCFGVKSGGHCSQARPIPLLSDITIRQSSGRAFYRGLTFRSVYRRRRAQFQAYYTLSWNYSNDDNERLASGFNYDNSFNFKPEYGFSLLDVRHLFEASGLVELPWGFTVSSLAHLRSGRPMDAPVGSDVNGDNNNFSDRAFLAPGVPFVRDSFRDRAFYDVDMRLAKSIRLAESKSLQFTLDFFNLFNWDNVIFLSGSSGTPSPFVPTNVYGVGVNSAGAVVGPLPQFQQLQSSAFCSAQNKGCYNTNNAPGPPLTVQLGVRFDF